MLRAVLAITSAVVANNCIAQLNLSAVSCTLKLLSTDNGDVRFFLPFMSCLSITYSPSLFPVLAPHLEPRCAHIFCFKLFLFCTKIYSLLFVYISSIM